jgi:hypothetical protein
VALFTFALGAAFSECSFRAPATHHAHNIKIILSHETSPEIALMRIGELSFYPNLCMNAGGKLEDRESAQAAFRECDCMLACGRSHAVPPKTVVNNLWLFFELSCIRKDTQM